MRIGFCGLGLMGAPMAARLLGVGHELVVWNRRRDKGGPLVEKGARWADSPAQAAAEADAVITMLATPEALESVVFGHDGIASGIRPGVVFLEMSTVGREVVTDVAARLPEGVEMVDAPVLGSTPEAVEGSLSVFVGSSPETFRRLEELLSVIGKPVHIGPFGSGAATKLVVNSTLGAIFLAFGEALALADAMGLDGAKTLDVLEQSPIGATVKKKRQKIETGVYDPNFRLSLAVKDMRLVTEAGRGAEVELRGAAAALAAFQGADDAGLGDCDYSAVVAFLSGREAKPS